MVASEIEHTYSLRQDLIAMTLDAKGDRTESLSYYEQVRECVENLRDDYPDNPRFHAALGKIYAKTGKYEEAIEKGESLLLIVNPICFKGATGLPVRPVAIR